LYIIFISLLYSQHPMMRYLSLEHSTKRCCYVAYAIIPWISKWASWGDTKVFANGKCVVRNHLVEWNFILWNEDNWFNSYSYRCLLTL